VESLLRLLDRSWQTRARIATFRINFGDFAVSQQVARQENRDAPAVVQRIVPGRLVYVTPVDAPDRVVGFKLDQLVIREVDGAVRPYRGESLSTLGLATGRKVSVWQAPTGEAKAILVIDAPRGQTGYIGSSITNAISNTIGKFIR
jgi:hypothetical protein